jgi:hypothetical protein
MNLAKIYRFLIIVLCVVIGFANSTVAQKTYFVYLQSDNQQQFYVTFHGKNITSSSIGYVILSKLTDSTYPITIGFPATGTVQDFDLKVSGDDQGFLVKNFGEKGYGLFNLQTLAVQMNNSDAKKKAADAAIVAEAAKQTTDSLNTIAAQVAATDSTGQALGQQQAKTDSVAAVKTGAAAVLGTEAAVKNSGETISATAQKEVAAGLAVGLIVAPSLAESKTKADVVDSAVLTKQLIEHDTVTSVPVDSVQKIVATTTDTASQKAISKTDSAITNDTAIVDKTAADPTKQVSTGGKAVVVAAAASPKFLDMDLNSDTTGTMPGKKVDPTDSAAAIKAAAAESKPDTGKKKDSAGLTSNNGNTKIVTVPVVVAAESPYAASLAINAACKQSATDKDFFALRKKMVATEDTDEMIGIAKKVFKEKCFSTAQVRNLAVLFLDDAGRYAFFDEVYPYTNDQPNFKQLSDLLKDDYYVKRFNAMLK